MLLDYVKAVEFQVVYVRKRSDSGFMSLRFKIFYLFLKGQFITT